MTKSLTKVNLHELFSIDKVKTLDKFYESFLSYLDVHAKKSGITAMRASLDFREVSNSHCSPLSGVHNFERLHDRPMSYPGFSGSVMFFQRASSAIIPFRSDFPDGLNTGGGSWWSFTNVVCELIRGTNKDIVSWAVENGFNDMAEYWTCADRAESKGIGMNSLLLKTEQRLGVSLRYDLRMFCDDFPALKHFVELTETFNAIQNKDSTIALDFLWSDPEVISGLPKSFVKIY